MLADECFGGRLWRGLAGERQGDEGREWCPVDVYVALQAFLVQDLGPTHPELNSLLFAMDSFWVAVVAVMVVLATAIQAARAAEAAARQAETAAAAQGTAAGG